jgi:hypothetical protein
MGEIPCIIVGNLLVMVIAVFFSICLVILYHVSVCGWEAVGAVFFLIFGFVL